MRSYNLIYQSGVKAAHKRHHKAGAGRKPFADDRDEARNDRHLLRTLETVVEGKERRKDRTRRMNRINEAKLRREFPDLLGVWEEDKAAGGGKLVIEPLSAIKGGEKLYAIEYTPSIHHNPWAVNMLGMPVGLNIESGVADEDHAFNAIKTAKKNGYVLTIPLKDYVISTHRQEKVQLEIDAELEAERLRVEQNAAPLMSWLK